LSMRCQSTKYGTWGVTTISVIDWVLSERLLPTWYVVEVKRDGFMVLVSGDRIGIYAAYPFVVIADAKDVPENLRSEFQFEGTVYSNGHVHVPAAVAELFRSKGVNELRRFRVAEKRVLLYAPPDFLTPTQAEAVVEHATKDLRRVMKWALYFPDERWQEIASLLDKVIAVEKFLGK